MQLSNALTNAAPLLPNVFAPGVGAAGGGGGTWGVGGKGDWLNTAPGICTSSGYVARTVKVPFA